MEGDRDRTAVLPDGDEVLDVEEVIRGGDAEAANLGGAGVAEVLPKYPRSPCSKSGTAS